MEVSGYYNELLTQDEIMSDEKRERDYDLQEEMDALDIDDNDNLYGDNDEEEFNSFDVDDS